MAEKVQFNMEKQVAELRDLKERELFDSEELSAIVSRRTALETALHARTVQPKDFLNYVDYERRLDELRGIRAKKQHTQQLQQAKAAKGKGKKVKKQHSLSDYSMARRQTRLLQMGCRRFPTDQILWDRLLAHLYSIKPFPETDVSKTLMSAVAAMPLSHKYWTLAARFQDRSGDTAAARKMFMRAIRVCGHSIEMWETWLLFEVSVAQKLRERWILLGLIKEDQVANDEPPGTTPEGKISLDVESEDPQPPPEAQQENAVLQGQIAKVVIDHALQRHPNSHVHLASALQEKPVHLTSALLEHILATLPSDSPLTFTWAWSTIAPHASESERLDALHQALTACKKAKRWDIAATFTQARLAECDKPEISAYLQGQLERAQRKVTEHN